MPSLFRVAHFILTAYGCMTLAALAQAPQLPQQGNVPRKQLNDYIETFPGGQTAGERWAKLPTDRMLRNEAGLPLENSLASANPPADGAIPPHLDFKDLLTPRVRLAGEWEAETEGISLGSYDASLTMPSYPFFGPPPPLITGSYSFTQINAPQQFDLPASLHEFSLGLAWMRKINDRWMARFMLSGAFASDLENTTSDAWQLRAGAFALYRPDDYWNFAFGALVTGRDDIPVIPAIGAVWQSSPTLKVNLMLPNPKILFLVKDNGVRQHWFYIGGGMSGGTWAYLRQSGEGERLSYREWRVLLGWEVVPPQPPGSFIPPRNRITVEVGYVLGRKFEFESTGDDFSIDGTLLLRGGISF